MNTYTFSVTGMHCASCSMLIDETMEDLPGVSRSETSQRAERTTIQADPALFTVDTAMAAIIELGYQVKLEQS